MKLVDATAAAVLLCFVMSVAAAPGFAREPEPMQQGAKSVNKNLREQPDNKGLQQANDRLDDNRERFRDRHDNVSGAGRAGINKIEKVERPDRPERAERLDANVIVDRPGNSEFGRSRRP